ncbi:MAG: ATP-binding cassette domain-containing protein [Chitinispirillia bacterium]|jgi:ABC-2 type transport system ATP-binding protein
MSTTNNSTMLEVQKLNKRFGNVQAVKDLSFKIKKGEVFGFLGPNGAGKTTTMRMITCFIPPSSGTIKIDKLDTIEGSFQIRKKIGYLPENAPLYNDMLVDEYLTFVGSLRGFSGHTLSAAKENMYKVCNLTTMKRRQIGKLSKGYRQRVGLAQAMIHNPDLLILDEPTSGLDPNQIIEIRELIKNIGKEKTVIYCSHILSEVSATCSRILIINDGITVATGTADELTSKSGKGDQYRLRVKGEKDIIINRLKELPNVTAATISEVTDEWVHITVNSEGSADIGEQLFRCIVDNGWSLAELKHEATSLEDVFTKLTRG